MIEPKIFTAYYEDDFGTKFGAFLSDDPNMAERVGCQVAKEEDYLAALERIAELESAEQDAKHYKELAAANHQLVDKYKVQRDAALSENEELKNSRNRLALTSERDNWSRRAEAAEAERDALLAEREELMKQEPAVRIDGKRIAWNPNYNGGGGEFYARPVPAQQDSDHSIVYSCAYCGVIENDKLTACHCLPYGKPQLWNTHKVFPAIPDCDPDSDEAPKLISPTPSPVVAVQEWDEQAYKAACESVEYWKRRFQESENALEKIRNDMAPMYMGEPLITSSAVAVPDGWKLVPIEPTEDMLDSYEYVGGSCYSCSQQLASPDDVRRVYKEILLSAPTPPSAEPISAGTVLQPGIYFVDANNVYAALTSAAVEPPMAIDFYRPKTGWYWVHGDDKKFKPVFVNGNVDIPYMILDGERLALDYLDGFSSYPAAMPYLEDEPKNPGAAYLQVFLNDSRFDAMVNAMPAALIEKFHSRVVERTADRDDWKLYANNLEEDIAKLQSTKPQRITEQDAFDIALNFSWFRGDFKTKNGYDPKLINWRDSGCKSLLAKLNENREPDYKAQRDELLAVLIDLTGYAEAVNEGHLATTELVDCARVLIAKHEGEK